MTYEIITAVVSTVVGGIVTLLLSRQKEKYKDRLETKKLQQEVFQTRPEMQIIDFKDYIARIGYGVKEKCDIALFVARIENVMIEGKKKREIVYANYKEDHLNPSEWCCVIYTFKNTGKTDISTMNISWNFRQSSCIFPADEARRWAEGNLLNYFCCYDKKIHVGENVSLKICYHKEVVIPGLFSATVSLGMIDDNGRYWVQPLFAPRNKLYDSRAISPKEYIAQMRIDTAEECFKKPWLR